MQSTVTRLRKAGTSASLATSWREHSPVFRDLLLLVVLVACLSWKLTLTRQFTFLEFPDLAYQVLPWLQVQATALRHGTIALWDPYFAGGQSLVGQLQPAVTSPITYLLLAAPLREGHLQFEFVHYWFVLIHCLAAFSAYLLCRDLKCSRAASVIAALFFAEAGFTGNTPWPQIVSVAIWEPLVLLFLLRSLHGRRPLASAALAGLFLGVAWLGGHHQVPLFLSLAVGGIFLFTVARRPKWWRVTLTRAAMLFAIMGLIGALQVLPAREYGKRAVRWVGSGLPIEPFGWDRTVPYLVHEQNSLRPADLPYTIVPGSHPGMAAVGLVAASLILLAIAGAWAALYVRLLAAVALGALLFALTGDVLHGLVYALVPLVEKARSPMMAMSIFQLGACGLVAIGADRFLSERDAPRVTHMAKYLGWFGVAALGIGFLWQPFRSAAADGDNHLGMVGVIAFLLAALCMGRAKGHISRASAAACLCGILMLELGSLGDSNYVFRQDPRRAVFLKPLAETEDVARFLRSRSGGKRVWINRDDVPFNFADWHGIDTFVGYTPSVPEQVDRLGWFDPRTHDLYAVGYTVSRQPLSPGQVEVFTGASGLKVFTNPSALPRAWSVHRLVEVRSLEEASALLRNSEFSPRAQSFLVGRLPVLEQCAGADRIGGVTETFDRVSLDVELGCRGMVVVSDNAFPGWCASVDGKAAPMHAAYTAIRGVVVDGGRHHIEMVYRPASVYFGLALTLLGAISAAVVCRLNRGNGVDLLFG